MLKMDRIKAKGNEDMMLLHGDITVTPQWHIAQQEAPGYCRAYWVHGGGAYYQDELVGRIPFLAGKIYLLPTAMPYITGQNPSEPLCCTFLHLDTSPYIIRRLVVMDCLTYPIEAALFAAARTAIIQERLPLLETLVSLLENELREAGEMEIACIAVSDSIHYIQSHLAEPIALSSLAAECGYQPQYFIRLFKKYMGLSPYKYARQCKMQYAAVLLRSGASITHVANATGYADAKVFSAVFKDYYQIAPSHYAMAKQLQP